MPSFGATLSESRSCVFLLGYLGSGSQRQGGDEHIEKTLSVGHLVSSSLMFQILTPTIMEQSVLEAQWARSIVFPKGSANLTTGCLLKTS
jgi:hypothetical protein